MNKQNSEGGSGKIKMGGPKTDSQVTSRQRLLNSSIIGTKTLFKSTLSFYHEAFLTLGHTVENIYTLKQQFRSLCESLLVVMPTPKDAYLYQISHRIHLFVFTSYILMTHGAKRNKKQGCIICYYCQLIWFAVVLAGFIFIYKCI